VEVNLAYRWFCKLSVEDKIPDHSVFSRARHERFRESDTLRRVFEGVVAKCIAAGLVGGEGFSIDASLIKADVDKKKRAPGDQPIAWPKADEASGAVREYLMTLDAARTYEEGGGGDDDASSGGGSRRKPLHRGGRRNRVPARLPARSRRHHLEAERLADSSLARLST
jgi:IS5 family transposase